MGFMNWELHEYPLLPINKFQTWSVKCASKMEVPRFVIIGFQTQRKNDQTKNASHFDFCNLSDIKLFLNGVQYPYNNVRTDFAKNRYDILYTMYYNFQQAYSGKRNEPILNRTKWKEDAALIVINCSHQNEIIKSGAVDVRLEWETAEDTPANTTAYCLILHDKVVRYKPLSSVVEVVV
jgi:hypothetical protein